MASPIRICIKSCRPQTRRPSSAACGEGVSRSTDRGSRWEKVTPAGDRTYGNALAEDDMAIFIWESPGTGHAPGRAPGGQKTAIFKSQDGANWELLTEKISGGVMDSARFRTAKAC